MVLLRDVELLLVQLMTRYPDVYNGKQPVSADVLIELARAILSTKGTHQPSQSDVIALAQAAFDSLRGDEPDERGQSSAPLTRKPLNTVDADPDAYRPNPDD